MTLKSIKKARIMCMVTVICALCLGVRLYYLCIVRHNYYSELARDVQERTRKIKSPRGLIYDRNGLIIADNTIVYTISVVHNQITDEKLVSQKLSEILELDISEVEKKVKKRSIRELIRTNVPEEKAKLIEEMQLEGVKVDADYKRIYPYGELASKVIGFTGADNQGILGLEVNYEDILTGVPGSINTVTTARGIEIEGEPERREEGTPGCNLITSLDVNLQMYAQEMAELVRERHKAKRVCIIMMNPQNGEIYAMVDSPEYDLNDPFTIIENIYDTDSSEELASASDAEIINDKRNRMWRCFPTNDTYEPGSIFKIVTACSALEDGVVSVQDQFYCPGYKLVADRRIKCHKTTGHGAETFAQGFMNSCNPVFMDVGARVGAESLYSHIEKLGLFEKTGIDLPGEASSIFHKPENIGPLELATMSFGQSFQITPLQLIRAVSAVINGGTLVTPHLGMYVTDSDGNIIKKLEYEEESGAVSEETSATMRILLRSVVAEGGGNKAYIEGYDIGGKTATSEKLPRGNGRYISSFIGFAPVDNPEIITLIMIDEPKGVYYGGTIAAPVVGELYKNILPYLGIEMGEREDEQE